MKSDGALILRKNLDDPKTVFLSVQSKLVPEIFLLFKKESKSRPALGNLTQKRSKT